MPTLSVDYQAVCMHLRVNGHFCADLNVSSASEPRLASVRPLLHRTRWWFPHTRLMILVERTEIAFLKVGILTSCTSPRYDEYRALVRCAVPPSPSGSRCAPPPSPAAPHQMSGSDLQEIGSISSVRGPTSLVRPGPWLASE